MTLKWFSKRSALGALTRVAALAGLALLAALAPLAASARAAHPAGSGAPDTNLAAAPLTNPPPPAAPPSEAPSTDEDDADETPATETPATTHRHHHSGHDQNDIVNFNHDSQLDASAHAGSVVSILGSSTSAGVVSDTVISVLGNTRVTGPVGDSAVAILGNVYVDSAIAGQVVAILGNVELGPHAVIGGDVVSVGGSIKRDPAAVVKGDEQSIAIGATLEDINWLRPWIAQCLFKGRLLAFAPGITWAWTFALVSLGLYALCALLFRPALARCVQTLETYPLQSIVTALLTTLATPILLILLCITVVGILAVPFVGIALLAAGGFGKLVVLTWLGQRLLRSIGASAMPHPTGSVLLGGVIVLLLYTVPVLSLIVYKLIGFIGLGVVVYSVLLAVRSRRAAPPPAAPASAATAAPAAAAAAAAAAPADSVPPAAGAPNLAADAAQLRLAAVSYPRAGFWVRMAALLLDVILIGIILGIVLHSGRLHLLLLATYGAIMWKLRGATIGGIVFHLQVVRVDAAPLDWATAIVRSLSCFLSLFVVGLGFIWIAMDPENQAWHDKIAGTLVVRVPRSISLV